MLEIRNAIVKSLHEHTGTHAVPQDTTGKRPPYPFITYKINTVLNGNTYSRVDNVIESDNENFEHDVQVTRITQPKFTLSISAYSENELEAHDLAEKARQWFTFHGWLFLNDINVVVINATEVSERNQLLVDDIERRYGFDVRCR